MTSDNLIRTNRGEFELDVAAGATRALRSWQPLVRTLPQLIEADNRETALQELVTWYEAALSDEDYTSDPPIHGLDALVDELAQVKLPANIYVELNKARWAIRVAEELVTWRRAFPQPSGAGAFRAGPQTDLLELAIEAARRQMADS